MATKVEVIKEMEGSSVLHFTKPMVRALIDKVSYESFKPCYLKVGDVFIYNSGTKKRPVVVVKVDDDLVFGIPLSSTEDEMNLIPSKSRFFGDGFFSKALVTAKMSVALDSFIGMYDNEKLLRKARKALKSLLMSKL